MYIQIAQKDLIPLNRRSKEEQKRIQSKGGSVSNDKIKLAAHVREAKKWGIKAGVASKVYALLQSPELSSTDWYKHIDVLEEMSKEEPRLIPTIINFKKDWHKAAHGEKLKTENVHHIINWSDMLKEVEIGEVRPKETD